MSHSPMHEVRAVDGRLAEAMSELTKLVEEHSDHEEVTVKTMHTASSDVYRVTMTCKACKNRWELAIRREKLFHADNMTVQEVFQADIIPFFRRAATQACWSLTDASLLAEWITERLAAAGNTGIPYMQFVREAASKRLAPAGQIDMMLRKMGFLEGWTPVGPVMTHEMLIELGANPKFTLPRLKLPLDHPAASAATSKEEK